MKSIGQILKEERLKKQLSVEHVVDETHIARQQIVALEADEFEKIPGGEANFLGFLRMYALFLGLDVDYIVGIYRNHKLVEEQMPYEELLKKSTNWRKILFISVGVLIGILTMIFILVKIIDSKSSTSVVLSSHKLKQIHRTLNFGQQFRVKIDDYIYDLIFNFNDLEEIEGLIRGEDGEQSFSLSSLEPVYIVLSSLNASFEQDFTLRLLRGNLKGRDRFILIFQLEGDTQKIESTDLENEVLLASNDELDASLLQGQKVSQRQILMSVRSPIQVNPIISFRGYVYYRHRLDNGEVLERYYQAGDQLQRNMHNSMKIWVSNAGRTHLKIGLNEYPLGRDGDVGVKLLNWQRNAQTGMLDLVLEDV